MKKLFSVDNYGRDIQSPDYGKEIDPYEVDAPTGDTGVTYMRYLNRDVTAIHRVTVTESDGRSNIKLEIGFGAWADRENLDYYPPSEFPKVFEIEYPDPEEESESGSASGSESASESGSEPAPESGSAPESASGSDPGSESGTEPLPESGSEPASDSGSAPDSESGTEPASDPGSSGGSESGSAE